MNLKQFQDALLQGEGASYGIYNGVLNPNHGFMASYKDSEAIVPVKDFVLNAHEIIKSFVFENAEKLSQSFHYLGGWIFNDCVYLDVSKQFTNQSDATVFADVNEQLAIYDCNNGEVIDINRMVEKA